MKAQISVTIEDINTGINTYNWSEKHPIVHALKRYFSPYLSKTERLTLTEKGFLITDYVFKPYTWGGQQKQLKFPTFIMLINFPPKLFIL